MNAERILATLEQHGVRARAQGSTLLLAPKQKVPSDLVPELKAHKAEILAALGARVGDGLGGVEEEGVTLRVDDVAAMSLDDFATARLVVTVFSSVLGERVLFASDNAVIDPGETRAVYRATELRELLGLGAVDLQRTHEVKRTYRGSVRAS